MSYLNVPRLHFAGQFLTSPSTINNTPGNYVTSPTPPYPTYPPAVPSSSRVLWNPMGVALFELNGKNVNGTPLPGCYIQSVMPLTGDLATSENSSDPLLGASVQTSTDASPAKIVDLDPDQQLATLFIGIRMQLVLQDGTVAFSMQSGEFISPPNLTDYAGQGVFESRINPKQIVWNTKVKSRLFQSFRTACKSGISVKFIIGNYDTNIISATFNFGNIVGALGPAKRGEPVRASVDRKFIPQHSSPSYNSGYFQVDKQRKKLVIDFGNSTAFDYTPGKSPDINAALLQKNNIETIGDPLNYSRTQYQLTAGILELPISTPQITALKNNPLRFYAPGNSPTKPVLILSEYLAKSVTDFPTGSYITISQLSARLAFGESTSVDLIARKLGSALSGQELSMNIVPGTTARRGLQFTKKVTTSKNGKATIKLTAATPPLQGQRADIGSQLYFLQGKWKKTSYIGIGNWPVNGAPLSVKAYAKYVAPQNPTWETDVQPVMVHFMTLYPGMKAMHDLTQYPVVKKVSAELKTVFTTPIDHPGYMPVTRELNPAIMKMVVNWINRGMPRETTG